jgi:peroxiredoxin
MFNRCFSALALPLVLAVAPPPVSAQAVVGQPAPGFSLSGADGATHALDAYRGKTVVLEWLNHDCPFVRKHYGSGNMQKLQKTYTSKGVVWLSVISSAPGQQGHLEGPQALAITKEKGAAPTAVLLDPSGAVGRAYGAKTTPHMFVIDARGRLVYNGAIDDKPSTDVADVAAAANYVAGALDETLAGKAVTKATSPPYGCGIKYAD